MNQKGMSRLWNGSVYLAAGFLSAALALSIQPALAQVPELINYQARLTNSAGAPLTGNHTLVFRIFDAESLGNQLTETSPQTVVASNGLVSAKIPAAASLFSGANRWLEVLVNGEALSPRTQLLSVPYALKAGQAGEQALLTFRLLGVSVLKTNVDGGAAAPFTGTIVSVNLFRRVPGTSGSAKVDIHKNGITIFTNQLNRPELLYNAVDKQMTRTNMDDTAVTAGDILTCDVDEVDEGNPEDIVVEVKLRAS